MDRSGAAARPPESDRKELAIQALSRSKTVSDLVTRHGASGTFVYHRARKARVALALICHGSYRGVIEFMRDLLGISRELMTKQSHPHRLLGLGPFQPRRA
jgi:hypothetical protein